MAKKKWSKWFIIMIYLFDRPFMYNNGELVSMCCMNEVEIKTKLIFFYFFKYNIT